MPRAMLYCLLFKFQRDAWEKEIFRNTLWTGDRAEEGFCFEVDMSRLPGSWAEA